MSEGKQRQEDNGTHAPWKRSIEGSMSQYAVDGVASCTVIALECALRVVHDAGPSQDLSDEIVRAGALFSGDRHSAVDDVFPHVTRYHSRMEQCYMQSELIRNMDSIVQRLSSLAEGERRSVAAVLTKPPESVLLFARFSQSDDGSSVVTPWIFDSHPRHELGLESAHFLEFTTFADASSYLTTHLFQYQDFGGDIGYQGDMYNTIEATYFSRAHKDSHLLSLTDEQELATFRKEISSVGQRLGVNAASGSNTEPVSSLSTADQNERLQQITAMGFSSEQARAALEKHMWSVEAALNSILM